LVEFRIQVLGDVLAGRVALALLQHGVEKLLGVEFLEGGGDVLVDGEQDGGSVREDVLNLKKKKEEDTVSHS
jgi:hypothetical protein